MPSDHPIAARCVLLCLGLAGCAPEPNWVLLDPPTETYVDTRSMGRDGRTIVAVLRAKTITQYNIVSSYFAMGVAINCEGKEWRDVSFQSLDESGRRVGEVRKSSRREFYAVTDWDHPRNVIRLICEHVNDGRPLA